MCACVCEFIYHCSKNRNIMHPPTLTHTRTSTHTHRNIVVPAQANGAPVKVIGAMYQKSPLGLGLLPTSKATSLKYVCVCVCVCVYFPPEHARDTYSHTYIHAHTHRDLAKPEIRVGMLADSLTLAQRMLHQAAGSKRCVCVYVCVCMYVCMYVCM